MVDIELVGKLDTLGLLCCNYEAVYYKETATCLVGTFLFVVLVCLFGFYLRGAIGNLLENFLASNLSIKCS